MRCYKGFNSDLTCSRGQGRFQYKVGQTFTAEKAKCANTGLHCVEEPIAVLDWYNDKSSRFCIVEAAGDINENDDKISCTEMTILKEITIEQLAMLECIWLQDHPDREMNRRIHLKSADGCETDRIVIVRGKHPIASGCTGTTIFLLREKSRSKEIADIGVFKIDGKKYKPHVRYTVEGRRSTTCAKKNSGS